MDLRLPTALQFGNAQFDSLSGVLKVEGRDFRLRPQTSAVLAHLLTHAGEIVSKDDLQNAVWSDTVVTENSLSQCISEIRQALGTSASTMLETVPRRGYLLRANPSALPLLNHSSPVTTALATEPIAPVLVDISTPLNKLSHLSRLKPWRAELLLVLLMGIVSAGWVVMRSKSPEPQLTLAVLPFEVKGLNADLAWFGDVVGEDLTFNLARIPGAQVISRVSTQAYPASGMDARTIGKELGVRYLVGGSLRQEGDQVVLNLHLADTQSGRQQWAERFATSVAELPRTEHWAAQRIAQALHLQLIGEFAQQTAQYTPQQLDAQTLALQAWAAWNRDTPKDAERAKALALQALAIDERSVLALKTMSSWHLRARINQSMPAEEALAGAEAYAQRALAIDPRHPLVHTVMGGALTLRGDYEQAVSHLEQEIASNPSHPVAYYYLGLSRLMLGDPVRSAKVYEQLITISPRDTRLSRYYRNLAVAYLHQGRTKPALQFATLATQTPQPFANAWATLASICALNADTACSQTALVKFLSIRPGFDIEQVEAEWPPSGSKFKLQHAEFLRGLQLAGLPDKRLQP